MTPRKDGDSTGGTSEQDATPHFVATPLHSRDTAFIGASGSLTRRVTRSMTKIQSDSTINSTPGSATRLQERLRGASSKSGSHIRYSNLEESRTIAYNDGNQDDGAIDEDGDDEEPAIIVARHPTTRSSLARGRYSQRTQGNASSRYPTRRKAAKAPTRDSTPSDALSAAAGDRDRPRKRRKLDAAPRSLSVRRSPRLAKPLMDFHKFPCLPIELQMMVWEAAIIPRIIYLRNKFTLAPTPLLGVQNKIPTWFMACRLSLKVALQKYQNKFPLTTQSDLTIRQPINPEVDIVLFEPCCNGCRARSCAGRNFEVGDRASIRTLAVQTESPFLMPNAQPCWMTIADAWPSVDTIYLLKTAIKGDDRREKAMIRAEEGEHEGNLRKRFSEWKKGAGKDKPVQRIEFVTVTEKENNVPYPKDRYKSIHDRKTGLPEDIILG